MLISPANGATRRITAPDDVVRQALSLDGQRIAITGFRGIWVKPSNDSPARHIVHETLDAQIRAGEIAWSPDGRRLVFARGDDSLFTISADGSGLRRVARHADEPTWSPNKREIVFIQSPDQSSRAGIISALNLEDGEVRILVRGRKWNDPRVSPDGSTLAFDGPKGIYLASIKGGEPRLLIPNGYGPAWSPDGRYIAFARNLRCAAVCTSRVFVARISDTTSRPVGPEIGDMAPVSWSR